MRRALAAVLLVAAVAARAGAQDAKALRPWEEARPGLVVAVARLAALAQPDGSWKPAGGPGGDEIGSIALPALAIYQARRYLNGDESDKAFQSASKGLALIVQRPPGADVVSESLVLLLLNKTDPTRYHPKIGAAALAVLNVPFTTGPNARSQTFFALLGLAKARAEGFQPPRVVWEKARLSLVGVQLPDGGWGPGGASGAVETFEGAAALYVVEEMLQPDGDKDSVSESPELERAMAAAGRHVKPGLSPYAWFALSQLANASKRAEFGGVDWRRLSIEDLAARMRDGKFTTAQDLSYAVLALAQDLAPVVIQKLRRPGDWETRRGDVRSLMEYYSDRFSLSKSWRVVSIDSSADFLSSAPVLWINGRKALAFDDAGKRKLKAYVARGGTIWAEAVAGSAEFDKSFRALAADLWPGAMFEKLPKGHVVFENPRPLKGALPEMLVLKLEDQAERISVVYFPKGGMGVGWARVQGGAVSSADRGPVDLAMNLLWYAERIADKARPPEPEPEPEKPAELPAAPIPTPSPAN